MAASLPTFIKHLWLDADDTARLISPDMMARLTEQVAASERLHHGEIRICVEASLPLSYLWRVGKDRSLASVTRERALMMFSKLGVWDTAQNNGVLIYVLLAEHAIEIVADRGISAHVGEAHWSAVVQQMSQDFQQGRAEEALQHALENITALLVQHFGSAAEAAHSAAADAAKKPNANELPDAPLLG